MNHSDGGIAIIGVDREELRWLRTLVWLLRHPDPSVPELARQALLYLTGAAQERNSGEAQNDFSEEIGDEPYCSGPSLVS